MKAVLIISTLFLLSFGLVNAPESSVHHHASLMDVVNSEFVKPTNSIKLRKEIQRNFSPLFDEVSKIDVHFNNEAGYYYAVYGVKSEKSTIELIMASESEVNSEQYNHIDFSSVDATAVVQYCKFRPSSYPGCPAIVCEYDPSGCIGQICGVWDGRTCNRQ